MSRENIPVEIAAGSMRKRGVVASSPDPPSLPAGGPRQAATGGGPWRPAQDEASNRGSGPGTAGGGEVNVHLCGALALSPPASETSFAVGGYVSAVARARVG